MQQMARFARDRLDAGRGTRRNLKLLEQRQFRVSKPPKGIVGWR
jgi:hypothetical protein